MKTHAFILGVVAFLAATVLASFLNPLHAEIIGVEQFDYPDGPIAGQRGGTFWDWQNRLTPAPGPRHTGTPSDWENFNLVSSVASGRLVTDNTSFRREYNGLIGGPGGIIETDEGYGAINNFNGNGLSFREHVVYYRVTLTTGAAVPQSITISSSDFGTERVAFGVTANNGSDLRFSIRNQLGIILSSSFSAAPNMTYTLVAKLDFVAGQVRLYLNPDLNAAESSQTPLVSLAFDPAFWSSSVQLGSGTGGSVTWDDLVVATTWDELGTVVTTTADEDDISLIPGINNGSGGTGVSLREAVKYSPAGSLITFDPALNGKTITLTHADGHIRVDKTLGIDASALPMGITIDGNHTSRHFFVTGANTAFALHALTLCNGTDLRDPEVFGGGFGGSVLLRDGKIAFRRCTFVGNTSINAGAIWLEGAGSSIMENCTFTGNRGTDTIASGGIVVASGNLRLIHCTLSENIGAVYGALTFAEPATVNLQACIIARNRSVLGDFRDVSIFGDFSDSTAESNLIGSNVGVQGFFPSGPLVGTQDAPLNPKLSPLGYFGGPTQTMHPLTGSPAIDAGGTTDPGGTDQRGFPRFVNGDTASSGAQLDIGAVEAGPLRTVFTKSDTGSGQALRSILAGATSPGTRISFSSIIFPTDTITLNGTELSIPATASIFIDASNLSGPITISGNSTTPSRVFNIAAGASVAMHSLKIIGGNATDSGGGIFNEGVCTVMSSTLSGNSANGGLNTGGGGIVNFGTCAVVSSTLSGNTAVTLGGGIYNEGICTVMSSTFSGNSSLSGGGIFNADTCTVMSSTLSGNSASSVAGGIRNFTGRTLNLTASILAGNSAPTNANILGTLTTDTNNLTSGDPLLAPLANNGGPTQTLALLAGSPAINAATDSNATRDQRGFPIVGVADIGAFEGQIGSVPSLTTAEDTPVTSASFPAGLVGTVTATSSAPSLVAPANIVLTTNGITGTLQITPAANANGSATITLQDDFGAQQTFSITVNAVNDAPTFTAGPNVSVLNTAGAQTVSAWATAISPGPADESAQTLTFALTPTNAALFSVLPTLSSTGTLTFAPAPGAVGTSTIAVRLRDNGGTSNGGIDESAAQNFTITFTATPPPAPLTRLIRVRANVSNRGTVSGGKRYVNNSFATVRARAKRGFTFTKWTEGTRTVSTKPSYRFKVTKNRSLVANFK